MADKKDSLLTQEKNVTDLYKKITGIQASNAQDLERIYKMSLSVEKEKDEVILNLEKQLKKVNVNKSLWKLGTFVLAPSGLIGGFILGIKSKR